VDCTEARDLIGPYLDGELDAGRAVALEHHLAGCAECTKALAAAEALKAALRDKLPYRAAPPALRAALGGNAAEPGARRAMPQWMRLAASFVLVAGLSSAATYYATPHGGNLVADEVFASHVRGLLSERRMIDVASSDEHTVKPWFDSHVDFSPPVKDLTTDGFPLLGGRTDYIAGRTVAALLFRHRQHVITLFVWPSSAAASGLETLERRGDHLVHWDENGMAFWAISDVDEAALVDFARRYRAAPTLPEPAAKKP